MSPEAPRHVLVVCTANICRSPMAEGLLKAAADRRGRPVAVKSGGVMGLIGRPADPKAVKVCKELDIDLSAHRSQGIDAATVAWADFILVMELRHQIELHRRFPESEGKVMLLGNFGGMHEIDDPVGGWTFRFRRSRDRLQRCVEAFLDQLPVRPLSAE